MNQNTNPWWLNPLFCFFIGVAVTAGGLARSINTPDYQLGHEDGYSACSKDMSKSLQDDATNALRSGIEMGYEAGSLGRPIESILPTK